MEKRTESESLTEAALTSLGIEYKRIPESTTETPDYVLNIAGQIVFVEVKQIEPNATDERIAKDIKEKGSAAYWPATESRIRKKIHAANKQLRSLCNGKHAGLYVLYSDCATGNFDWEDIHAAMYGSESYVVVNPSSEDAQLIGPHLNRDGQLKEARSTSTSAIVTLGTNHAGDPILRFYHNKHAKVPFASEWLRHERVFHFRSAYVQLSDEIGWERI